MNVYQYARETDNTSIVIRDECDNILFYGDIENIPTRLYSIDIIYVLYSNLYGTNILVVKEDS